MTIRRILLVLSVLTILVGFTQIIFAKWWALAARGIYAGDWPRLWGLVGMILGGLLIAAAYQRIISLRWLMYFVGTVAIVLGVMLVASPSLSRIVTEGAFLNYPWVYRVWVMRVAGLLRVLIGAGIIYALTIPPPRTTPEPSV